MIEDLEGVEHITLQHSDMLAEVQIHVHRYEGARMVSPFWGEEKTISSGWIDIRVLRLTEIPSRTEWNDPDSGIFVGYDGYWQRPLAGLPAKLAAYEQAGYQVARVRRLNDA